MKCKCKCNGIVYFVVPTNFCFSLKLLIIPCLLSYKNSLFYPFFPSFRYSQLTFYNIFVVVVVVVGFY